MRRLNIILGLVCMLGISAPMIIQWGGFMKVKGLNGYTNTDTTTLSMSWWNGDLQKRLENEATDSLVIFPACVRTRNQFEYSFFDKLNAENIYEFHGIFYRYTYPGYNEQHEFSGEQKIREQVSRLAAIGKQTGKPVYVVIATNKMRYYPEYLPQANRIHSDSNNYSWYKKLLPEAGIHVLDAQEWHYRNKKHEKIPIMAKQGVHWTLYGATITMDSLIRRLRGDLKLDLQEVKMELTQEVYEPDIDIANLCNLVKTPVDRRLRNVYFPEIQEKKRHLRPIIVGDSFFNAIEWSGLHRQIFDPETPFYYYFNTRFTNLPSSDPVDWKVVHKDIEQADCIIILTDIQNMSRFGFGFIEAYPLKIQK